MTKNKYLEEEYEHEFDKNFIYLYERQMEEEQEYYEYINKLPAKINVIKEKENMAHFK